MAPARMPATVILALALLGTAMACQYTCPSGYTVVTDYSTDCGYACMTPYNPWCLGQLGKSIQCGGTTGVFCPAVACTTSYSSAYAGPTGCARAQSAIAAYSVGQVVTAFAGTNIWNASEICSAGGDPAVYAEAAATAYAQAVALSLINYDAYVCSCCTGNSKAYTNVAAAVQAVAQAYAESCQQALVEVDCYGALLAGSSAVTDAIAQDTQLAIESVYQQYVSTKGNTCTSTGLQTKIQYAVASALACSFLQVYAAYDVATQNVDAYSCSATVALAGEGWTASCPITYCPTWTGQP